MSETRHMARYYLPGSFFPEETRKQLDSRSVEEAVSKAPAGAFAFVLYELPDVDFKYDEARFKVNPVAQNESGRYYLGGEVLTVEELTEWVAKRPDEDHRVLLANIDGNGYKAAIRCRTGNWQPFTDEDELVEIPAHLETPHD